MKTLHAYIYDTLAALRVDAAGFMTPPVVSTVHPGGCEEASFQFKVPFDGSLIIPEFLGYNYELQLWDSLGCYWIGRIEDFYYDIEEGAVEWSVVAKGYGVNLDDELYSNQNVTGLQTSVVVSNALSALSTQIDSSSVTATGITLSGATAIPLKMMKAAQVINWAKRFGNSSDAQQVWFVYPTNAAGVHFTFKPRPTSAEVKAHIQDFAVNRGGLAGRRLYNSVMLQYNSSGSTVTADDTTLQGAGPNGWNLIKILPLFMNQLTQAADAQQVADTALAFAKTAKITAKDLVFKRGIRVLDENDQRLELTRIRAGMLLKIEGIYTNQSPISNLSLTDTALIAATSYDDATETLQITLESLDQYLDAIIGASQSMLEGRITLD